MEFKMGLLNRIFSDEYRWIFYVMIPFYLYGIGLINKEKKIGKIEIDKKIIRNIISFFKIRNYHTLISSNYNPHLNNVGRYAPRPSSGA